MLTARISRRVADSNLAHSHPPIIFRLWNMYTHKVLLKTHLCFLAVGNQRRRSGGFHSRNFSLESLLYLKDFLSIRQQSSVVGSDYSEKQAIASPKVTRVSARGRYAIKPIYIFLTKLLAITVTIIFTLNWSLQYWLINNAKQRNGMTIDRESWRYHPISIGNVLPSMAEELYPASGKNVEKSWSKKSSVFV